MKHQRFIELLNLYLDHEITPVEAAELEVEIYRDPAKRRIYEQYCQLHRACTLLNKQFLTGAPQPAGLPGGDTALAGDGRVVAFVDGSTTAALTWRRGLYAAGTFAAAACLALLLVPGPGTDDVELAGAADEAPVNTLREAPAYASFTRALVEPQSPDVFHTVMQMRPADGRGPVALPQFRESLPEDILVRWTRDASPMLAETVAPESVHLRSGMNHQVTLRPMESEGFTPAPEMISFQFER